MGLTVIDVRLDLSDLTRVFLFLRLGLDLFVFLFLLLWLTFT